ncbi:MAG TPA: inositol monophosphatase family protein [Dehalococcoidia bacterium]|nr:inositol monophosphatase family protein [Dehalococcoidia bacterium]
MSMPPLSTRLPEDDTAGEFEPVRAAAAEIAAAAGAELQHRFAAPGQVRFKSRKDADPVTEADEAVERFVRQRVAERFPAHDVLGEEGGGSTHPGEWLWVVDPLDGTANFANGLAVFAVSIGVLHRLRPVAAALYTTFGPEGRPCVLSARLGGGLLCDGELFVQPAAALSKRARLSGVPAGIHRAFALWRLRGQLPGETRSFGSTAAELGLVATGRWQYAVFSSPRLWDVAAGILLVRESGGAVYGDRRGRWQPLERIAPPRGKPLSEWKQAVIAGDAALLGQLTGKVRVRRSPRERAERLFGPECVDRAVSGWDRRGAPAVRRLLRLRSAVARRVGRES